MGIAVKTAPVKGAKTKKKFPGVAGLASAYSNDIGRVSLLSREEEIDLFQQLAKDVHPEARERIRKKIIEANLRLVVAIAKKYRRLNCHLKLADLVQAGSLGLMQAVDRFEYQLGNRFITYASPCIRGFILRLILEQERMIRVSDGLQKKLHQLKRAVNGLTQELGREPTPEEIITKSGFSLQEFLALKLFIHKTNILPLDYPVVVASSWYEDEEDRREWKGTKKDTLEDKDSSRPEEIMLQKERELAIRDLLRELEPKEKYVLELRFGLADGKSYTLEEIGQRMNVSKERIRQIEAKALRRLKHPKRIAILQSLL